MTSSRAEEPSSRQAGDAFGADAVDTVYLSFNTVADIEQFFEEISYTPQTWADGVREIPRMYTTEITEQWRERTLTELDVASKKRIFFRALPPWHFARTS